eukprot:TRINITY_DN3344_c0_g1_i2.p3 TRINITY_DN3344_c0_g1~~TRINITY_DN3344_c0_g1_i2.p3  ORF type:complete len:140 (-),score=42.62 TRINITY_DN3344_c0_g1_i2:74-493(-)
MSRLVFLAFALLAEVSLGNAAEAAPKCQGASCGRKKSGMNAMSLGLMQTGFKLQRGGVTERAAGKAAQEAAALDDGMPDLGFDDDEEVLAAQVRLMQTSVRHKSNGQQGDIDYLRDEDTMDEEEALGLIDAARDAGMKI